MPSAAGPAELRAFGFGSVSSPAAPDVASDVFTVLLVCTGNICRSPLAERLGRARLDRELGPQAGQVRWLSAGVRAAAGSGMDPDTAVVLRRLGGDPAGHVARQLDERLAESADLTLTMTRAHRRAVLERAPRALAQTFTLREAAELLRLVGDVRPAEAGLPARGRALVRLLAGGRAHRMSTAADDIPDPIGQPIEAHERCGQAIADALLPVLSRIAALREQPGEQLTDGPNAS